MVRAIVLGSLLPATNDPEGDLVLFEQLMAIDDAAFGRREPKLKPGQVAERVELDNPWDFFEYTIQGQKVDPEEIKQLTFPIRVDNYPGLKIRWSRQIYPSTKAALLVEGMRGMAYEEKVALCKRPEEIDPEWLYGPVWMAVNRHLGYLGIEVYSFDELTEQLGILRFGHRPRVGDTFCGGGSVPFEAARLGCYVYASDLNPIACMLTWGALNVLGAPPERRSEIEDEQQRVSEEVEREITELGIEHNERGDRAKAFLYCLETRCPQTGWMVPIVPTWVISKQRNVIARLHPDHEKKRFEIEIVSCVSDAEVEAAKHGTVQNEQLVHELDGHTYRTPIRTICGDYQDSDGVTRNQLRLWDKQDFKPRSDDIFQERLYAILWYKKESVGETQPKTYFTSVGDRDLERERTADLIVAENLEQWQEEGLVPDMPIEPGYNTDQPIKERGWRYWHQLFHPRELIMFSKLNRKTKSSPELALSLARMVDYNSKLCAWRGAVGRENNTHIFTNQAFNTFPNTVSRSWANMQTAWIPLRKNEHALSSERHEVKCEAANKLESRSEIWVTDPPPMQMQ